MDTTWETYIAVAAPLAYRPATVRASLLAGRSTRRHTGHWPDTLTEPDAWRWFAAIRDLAPRSRAHYLSRLNSYYAWAADLDPDRGPSPVARLPRVRVPRGRPSPVPHAAVLALMGEPQPVATWVALAYYAGLRRSEIAALAPEHVTTDHDGRAVLAITGKGGHRRLVPVVGPLATLLAAYPWPDELEPASVTGRVGRAMRRRGVAGSIHKIRHTFGMSTLAASGNIAAVQALMGHASLSTTEVYARADLAAAHAAMDATWAA